MQVLRRASLVFLLLWFSEGTTSAQIEVEHLGLNGVQVTSLSIYGSIIAAGTQNSGVFFQQSYQPDDTSWTFVGLNSIPVHTVYVHKSGPVGWAIGAGVEPVSQDSPSVYCSYMGGEFTPNSDGINDMLTHRIIALDGFPDPSICGETYALSHGILYRQNFTDTVWTPVYTGSFEAGLRCLRIHNRYPGIILMGGGEGYTGYFLAKSTDFGENWETISPPMFVQSVDFTGSNADTIFAAGESIMRSFDGGNTYEKVLSVGAYSEEILIDRNREKI